MLSRLAVSCCLALLAAGDAHALSLHVPVSDLLAPRILVEHEDLAPLRDEIILDCREGAAQASSVDGILCRFSATRRFRLEAALSVRLVKASEVMPHGELVMEIDGQRVAASEVTFMEAGVPVSTTLASEPTVLQPGEHVGRVSGMIICERRALAASALSGRHVLSRGIYQAMGVPVVDGEYRVKVTAPLETDKAYDAHVHIWTPSGYAAEAFLNRYDPAPMGETLKEIAVPEAGALTVVLNRGDELSLMFSTSAAPFVGLVIGAGARLNRVAQFRLHVGLVSGWGPLLFGVSMDTDLARRLTLTPQIKLATRPSFNPTSIMSFLLGSLSYSVGVGVPLQLTTPHHTGVRLTAGIHYFVGVDMIVDIFPSRPGDAVDAILLLTATL